MGQEAELLYRTVQWDQDLLQPAGKMAAGLLFNIKCSEEAAIHQLHLPHCETMDAPLPDGLLSVVHITDDGMSILEPLQVTDTHVVVRVPHLSAFGLVKDLFKRLLNKPVGGQVLLFLGQPNQRTQRQQLHVLLLPRNIHLCEVSRQQRPSVNIRAPSTCKLIQDQSYTLHCPQAIKIQPERADFELEFGPNYHPMFEIRLPTNTEEVTLTVKDHREMEVWKHDVDLTDPRRETPQRKVSAEDGLLSVRSEFVTRVTDPVLNQLLDKLHENRVINCEEMRLARAKHKEDKARDVIDMVQGKGSKASSVLIDALCELDPCLASELNFS